MTPDAAGSSPCRRPSRDPGSPHRRHRSTAVAGPAGTDEVTEFTRCLLQMTRGTIEVRAAAVECTSAAHDVAWWEATLRVDRALHRRGTRRQAAMAAQAAVEAVLTASARDGLAPDAEVTSVARSAAEVARMLVAGGPSATGAWFLVRGWEDLLRPTKGRRR